MQVRNKTTGSRGECVLYYDRVTGRYKDPRSAEMDGEDEHGQEGSNGQSQTSQQSQAQKQQPSRQQVQQPPARHYSSSASSEQQAAEAAVADDGMLPVTDGSVQLLEGAEAELAEQALEAQEAELSKLLRRQQRSVGRDNGYNTKALQADSEEDYLKLQAERMDDLQGY